MSQMLTFIFLLIDNNYILPPIDRVWLLIEFFVKIKVAQIKELTCSQTAPQLTYE